MAYGTDVIPYSVGHCGIEPHLLTERFYRPLITPVTEASQNALPKSLQCSANPYGAS